MKIISVKLPENLDRALATAAKESGASKSEVIRTALKRYLLDGVRPSERSFLARAGDLAGCATGPPDLSTHRRYLAPYGK